MEPKYSLPWSSYYNQ